MRVGACNSHEMALNTCPLIVSAAGGLLSFDTDICACGIRFIHPSVRSFLMNKRKLSQSGRVCVLGLLFFLCLPMVSAFSQTGTMYRDEIKRHQNRVEQIGSEGSSKYQSEMSQVSSWIDEALILIDKNELANVKGLVLKAGVYIDYVEASVLRDRASAGARDAESRLRSLKADYGKLEAIVQQLSAEETLLKKQLEELNKSAAAPGGQL